MKVVPNQLPSADPGSLRIALIGESPGAEEEAQLRPFCGPSGWKLDQWLATAGVRRAQCFVGNVAQVRPSPKSNEFHLFEWHGAAVQDGIAALREDLAAFHPHIVVALGNAALHLLRHGNVAPPKSKKLGLFQWTSHVGTWRGSLFLGVSDFDPFAAAVLRSEEAQRGLSLSERKGTYATTEGNALQSTAHTISPHAPVPQPAPAGQNGATHNPTAPHPLDSTRPANGERLADGLRGEGSVPCALGPSPSLSAGCGVSATNALATSPCPGPATPSPLVGFNRPATEDAISPRWETGSGKAPSENDAEVCSVLRSGTAAMQDGAQPASLHLPSDSESPAPFKCLATYHPAATFREPSFTYPLVSDLKRAVSEARSPELVLPERHIVWSLSCDEVEARCEAIRAARAPVGFDIEGGLGGLQCASFATTPHAAFVMDFMDPTLDRPRLLRAMTSVLEDPAVPKVLWNAMYERAILEAVASIRLQAYEDGMLAWWERFSELPKGLDFVASILTREPYWAEGIGWDKKTGLPKVTGPRFFKYNGTDSCCTIEIWQNPLIQAVVNNRQSVPFEL